MINKIVGVCCLSLNFSLLPHGDKKRRLVMCYCQSAFTCLFV